MRQYLIIIEATSTGYSAYTPDIDGCVAIGATREEVEQKMRAALEFHLEGVRLEGYKVPEPQSSAAYVTVEA